MKMSKRQKIKRMREVEKRLLSLKKRKKKKKRQEGYHNSSKEDDGFPNKKSLQLPHRQRKQLSPLAKKKAVATPAKKTVTPAKAVVMPAKRGSHPKQSIGSNRW